MDSKQMNKEANTEQVSIDKRVMVNKNGDDKSMDSDVCIRTRCGGIIRKPDRLAYQNTQYIQTLHIQ